MVNPEGSVIGSTTVNITSGIASTIRNTTNTALTANTGTLAVAFKSIEDNNERLNKDITQINDQVALYQQQLLQKFAALESAISKVNNLLQSLSANQDAANNAN